MAGRSSDLLRRTLSACVFVPAILGLCWLGGWYLFALVTAVVARGAWEFYQLAGEAGHCPARWPGVLLAVACCFCVQFSGMAALALFLLFAIPAGLVSVLGRGVEDYLANALLTVGGIAYIGVLGSTPLLLADIAPGGTALVLLVFVGIWLTDAAAYLGGSLWGRRKLVPSISPAKTVAGLVAGLVGGLVPVVGYRLVDGLSWPLLLGLLLVASAGGQVGDLVESAYKRNVGVKDAPVLIPGHGGILDRFDSYFFAFPLAYLYITAVRGLSP